MLACAFLRHISVAGPQAPGCTNMISVCASLVVVIVLITQTITSNVARFGKLPVRLVELRILFPTVKDCALSPPLQTMHNSLHLYSPCTILPIIRALVTS